MVQVSGRDEGGQSASGRDAAGSFRSDENDTDAAGAGEAADNEGFHSGPQVSEEPAADGAGSPSGGPEDPPEEDQSPTGEQDPGQNPPLPRTWN